MLMSTHATAPTSSGLSVHLNVHYGSSSSEVLDSFMPAKITQPIPAVIFVHGGGWDSGDKSNLDAEAQAVADIGWAGISINYSLNKFPSGANDVLAAIQWVRAHAATYGINPDKIGVLGTSAGGNLAAEAIVNAKRQTGEDSGVAALITWSGPMDLRAVNTTRLAPSVLALIKNYIGCNYATCPNQYALASPIVGVASDDPPMMLFNSTDEVVPLLQATTMASSLRNSGVAASVYSITGTAHATEYASQAFPPSITFLSRYLGPIHGKLPSVPDRKQSI